MTAGLLRLAALAGVVVLGFALLAAVAAALLSPGISARARLLPPAVRARVLLAWAALPAAAGAGLLVLTLWPSLGAALGLAVDHCPAHVGHVHLCVHHPPASGPAAAGAIGLALGGLAVAAALARGARPLLLARRAARLRSFQLAPGVGAIDASTPLALTVGWFRPRVLVSTALLDRLTPPQLRVVVAHERAHADRRDALWLAAARLVSLAHLPGVRRRLLADLALASEQACDEVAARACGDRLLVAETIVAAERALALSPATGAALAFGGSDVAERVESLLERPPDAPRLRRALWAAAVAGLLAAGLLAPHVHHWTESLLDHLPH
ncbi:M56 family metallopeptidase [Anaeromyxobacter sp. Red801]|uniref:M56 family metallopeptidase n=1 Tax=Anaeromyxobacter sp. Red801 TaxID=3411632 RepID=UPI003BA29681